MADERDEIRARVDLVDLVGGRVALRRAGKVWKGLCPFHDDRTPSFTVDPTTGRYRCWSCGEHGDCFTWVMKTSHVEFPEALKELAERTGVQLQSRGPSVPKGERDAQKAAMAEALAFFREALGRSDPAKQYLENRGIDAATVEAWEIGYAPDTFEALLNRLRQKGHDLPLCKELFLVDERERGGYYDKFRGRLMFPIRDERGELVAFGGRIIGEGQPKYINSSDTPLYRKSRVLYGFDRAKEKIAKDRRAVLVEGYLDVIACHRAGETDAVASLGTALSEEHAKLLKRWAEDVTILYDADAAGQKAAERAVGLLRAEGVRVKVALMPNGEDPDTLLKKAGPAAVRRAVEGGLSPLDFAVGQLEARKSLEDESFWEELVTLLVAAPEGLDVERHLERFSGLYPGLRDPLAARRRLESIIVARRPARPQEAPPPKREWKPRRDAKPKANPEPEYAPPDPEPLAFLQERVNNIEACLFRAFFVPDFLRTAWMFACHKQELFITGAGLELARAIKATFPTAPPEGPPAVWLARLPERQAMAMSDLNSTGIDGTVTEPVLVGAIERLQKMAVQRRVRQLRQESTDDTMLRETNHQIKALNPEATGPEPSDEDDPFA